MDREQAQERIDELRGFYAHLASYIAVNIFLVFIDIMSGGPWWVQWPILGWGIGLVIHAAIVFWTGSDWEERKMQELTGWSVTQDEIEKLSERTENLVTILSNINWDKVDPDLIDTRETLRDAQKNIVRLRDHDDAAPSKDDVVRQLEKLEAFVTSPRFQFVDAAQSDPGKSAS